MIKKLYNWHVKEYKCCTLDEAYFDRLGTLTKIKYMIYFNSLAWKGVYAGVEEANERVSK